ncbi:MAG: aminoacyl-tRNA hydrolase [Opitutales bacterium]|nr:aminoacyl-tRNA hydrolase [Opitutales bacterium]
MSLFGKIFSKSSAKGGKVAPSPDMHIVAGLGNPGREYECTRHNIGWMLVDEVARAASGSWKKEPRFNAELCRVKLARKDVFLIKPLTYMNDSGSSIGKLMRYYGVKPEHVIIAHDEYQIPVGEIKVSIGGGDGGHNGIASVISHIGNTFVRYRLGIGSKRQLENGLKGFVLGKFEQDEMEQFRGQIADFASGISLVVDRGPVIGMNQLNKRSRNNDRNATA